jgi:hypothetical protein
VRSHAKASSVGSNSGGGASFGSFHRSGLLIGLLVALTAACLIPGSALAAETRPPLEAFGPDGTSGTTFELPNALAFDQGNEHLYALDPAPSKVHGFDASTPGTHTPLGGNFPLSVEAGGEVPDLAVDSASHSIYYVSEGTSSVYGFDSAAVALGGAFPLGGFGSPCGGAVDASGNIWVGEYGGQAVKEYDASGTLLDSVDVSAQGRPCHVALDSDANLYVSFYEGATWRYAAAVGYASATEVDPVAGAFPFASSPIAVDRTTDDLYVAHPDHVSVFDGTGAPLYEFGADIPGAAYTGVAIDQGSDRVYLSDSGHGVVQVFGPAALLPAVITEDADAVGATTATLNGTVNPNGKQLTDCHFDLVPASQYAVDQYQSVTPAQQTPCDPDAASIPPDSAVHAVSADVSGLSPGTTYHFRLVVASAEGAVEGVDRAFITGPPAISAQSVDAVGTSDVTVSAKINPKGAKTTYHVDYGTSASYGQSTPESLPIGFALDDSAHTVSVHIGGLAPGTAYHFRFVATSPAGAVQGTDTTFATYPSIPASGVCVNDQFRTGFGSRLPDCRAYEQATPIDKHGANIQGGLSRDASTLIQASSAGDRVLFYLNGGLPVSGGSPGLSAFMASRGPAGWSSDGVLPALGPSSLGSQALGWSEDLTTTAVGAPGPADVGSALYLRDSDTAAFQPAFVTPSEAIGDRLSDAYVPGFAADASHLIFESRGAFAPGAVAGEWNLYDLDHGTLTLAARIPAGSAASCDDVGGPACLPAPEGSFAGPYAWIGESSPVFGGTSGDYYTQNTISRDGSRVFFTTRTIGQLYVREGATKTVRISASQRTVPDPNGEKPAAFVAATPDGSTVFFASCEKLTDDSTAFSTGENSCTAANFGKPLQGQDLYSYDVESGELTDLTVDSNPGDPKGATVVGVLGASDDGSYVYFVANGVLAPGASSGDCRIGPLSSGANGSCNLYVSHDGATTFIAPIDNIDTSAWRPNVVFGQKESRIAADGRTLFFGSSRSLTGYDNGSSAVSCAGGHCREFFRYSAPDKELSCVSCNPTGRPPNGRATLGESFKATGDTTHSLVLTRNLSADGTRAFFESPDALLPTDTNGVKDVYEWEAEGSGGCHSESQNGGCLYLLSSGTSPDVSFFGNASADGDHVFIFTSQQLVPTDKDQLVDIYDAGVGSGLASQHALAPPTCTGVACQANPAPPPDQPASSATFSGPGNAHKRPAARKCPKGKRKVRRAGKVRCQKAPKQHKRHSNRGGSK